MNEKNEFNKQPCTAMDFKYHIRDRRDVITLQYVLRLCKKIVVSFPRRELLISLSDSRLTWIQVLTWIGIPNPMATLYYVELIPITQTLNLDPFQNSYP